MEFSHVPVLLNETIGLLSVKPSGVYLDGTAGGGGHSYEIANRLTEGGKLFATDRDGEAVRAAEERLAPFKDRVAVIRGNYADYRKLLAPYGVEKLDGILLDLGVSSHQFDDPERGFSYRSDGPLDMRMDERDSLTAADIVNGYPEKEICRVLRDYGEEPFAKNIAKHICLRREEEPLRTTFQLVDLIKAAIPAKMREKGGHPAKRTFQALRIETNGELKALREALTTMIDDLNEGGRIAVISFHSLEDRMVKQAFRTAEDPCVCPPDFPVRVCGRKPKGFQVTKHPVTASDEELTRNPRAKSAKLRVFEKRSEEA